MRILLTGKTGQVGWELHRSLSTLGEVVALGSAELDLARPDAIVQAVRAIKPDLIVNPAAHTAVDRAESEPELAMAINGIAPGILAEEAKRLGAQLVHYSTDYVFDGSKMSPYVEDDATNPLGVYGKTKLAGEQAIAAVGGRHLIFRTSWVYGSRGKNFLLTMQKLLQEREQLNVVADQIGAPTWSRTIATVTLQALCSAAQPQGIYHLTNGGSGSWYDFAGEIRNALAAAGLKAAMLNPIPSSQYPTPATRPANSRMATAKLCNAIGVTLPDWRLALALCLEK